MSARPTSLRYSALLAVALLGAGRANAQLATTSPFLPTQGPAAVGAPTPGAPLEFRAIMETAGGMLYRIVDPAKKNAGAWVKLNERDPSLDIVVKQHNASGDSDVVVVEQGGRTFNLPLRTPKVGSMGPANQNFVPPPPVASNVPPAVTNAVVVNPTPADEARRLEAVASEVARRRALREQATQQINQGVPVAPQIIQEQQRAQNIPPPPQQAPRAARGNAAAGARQQP
jgi:hypothetical protein